jgi:hypothetical protein
LHGALQDHHSNKGYLIAKPARPEGVAGELSRPTKGREIEGACHNGLVRSHLRGWQYHGHVASNLGKRSAKTG